MYDNDKPDRLDLLNYQINTRTRVTNGGTQVQLCGRQFPLHNFMTKQRAIRLTHHPRKIWILWTNFWSKKLRLS